MVLTYARQPNRPIYGLNHSGLLECRKQLRTNDRKPLPSEFLRAQVQSEYFNQNGRCIGRTPDAVDPSNNLQDLPIMLVRWGTQFKQSTGTPVVNNLPHDGLNLLPS